MWKIAITHFLFACGCEGTHEGQLLTVENHEEMKFNWFITFENKLTHLQMLQLSESYNS